MTIDLCYLVSGLQAQTQSSDECGTLPRRRITGDSQYQSDLDDGPSPDTPLRSPIRCISPEFANAIAMNPGGRPKEVGRKKKKKTADPQIGLTILHRLMFLSASLFLPAEKHAQLPGGV